MERVPHACPAARSPAARIQGAAIIGFGLLGWWAQMFTGSVAGNVAVALIAVFALGRSLCSISFKDVLGKTVDQGVRLGRSVHVVDMADRDNPATYTALSNPVVGLILLAGGVFGFIAQWLGIGAVLAIFTLMAAPAIRAAAGLDEGDRACS